MMSEQYTHGRIRGRTGFPQRCRELLSGLLSPLERHWPVGQGIPAGDDPVRLPVMPGVTHHSSTARAKRIAAPGSVRK